MGTMSPSVGGAGPAGRMRGDVRRSTPQQLSCSIFSIEQCLQHGPLWQHRAVRRVCRLIPGHGKGILNGHHPCFTLRGRDESCIINMTETKIVLPQGQSYS